MIPRNFVERYWKDVSNPISLKLPNGSVCKMFWLQLGDDVCLLDWKRFSRSLRCGDLLVFQYEGGSDFHVTIFDDSKLEIDYSSMIFNDEQEEAKKGDNDVIEITDESTNPSFELILTRTYAQGYLFRIPCEFSRTYMEDFEGGAFIRRVGEDRIWMIEVKYDQGLDFSTVTCGWKAFSEDNNLQIGDICKFRLTRSEPLTFTITITRARGIKS
ncbi:hypothetical protein TSUD_366840 [Trifolium subterraneum]|uniref:TF-B3 domain-containing protein n=1 Tax=Trifolium subterraneum TaxID=3900 RepID=A0A2Z6PF41_TRISU|nr:hypothetical protein TSUD_366840 [Trifolium subterraneum]